MLAPTRWKLRHAVKVLNGAHAALGLDKHPDKTFIGRVERGFDFLGYRLGRGEGAALATETLERHRRKVHRLQLQEREGRAPPGALGGIRAALRGLGTERTASP